ncbi:membrane progestin receptor beta isoform X1 [Vicugna pacos]|uniref:Membrane progestin receptor beta isoform X1 n=2 Tax=Vicugna pacos TaxID=30538 RepID=A0ABM5BWZ1_VICPA
MPCAFAHEPNLEDTGLTAVSCKWVYPSPGNTPIDGMTKSEGSTSVFHPGSQLCSVLSTKHPSLEIQLPCLFIRTYSCYESPILEDRKVASRAAMTTAILERLSTLSVSGQHLRRLPKILEDGLPKMPGTVPESDVPQLFREPYIHAGYRPTGHEWRYYFLSLFQKHNEVVNVWTHLLAALAVLLRFWAFVEAEGLPWTTAHALPLLLYVLSSITYLTFSLLAHLLQSKSELSHYTFYFVDYVGVSIYQYGSALVHFFYSSDQAWYERFWLFFLPAAAFCGWLSCAGCCYAKYRYRRPYPVMRKVCQVVPAGLAFILDISPVAHRVVLCHLSGCQEQAVWYHSLQIVFFLVSAYFFSCPVPEKYFPGSCDIVGHGHQIFHAFLSVCTLSQLEAILLDYKGRQEIFLQRHSPLSVYTACLSFFVLVACSAATAALLRQKIKARLTKKDS